jgi:hypothetical protein
MSARTEVFPCPWCEGGWCARGRIHDDGTEYRCLKCGRGHTRKQERADEVFFFFPGDIAAMVDPSIHPLLTWN